MFSKSKKEIKRLSQTLEAERNKVEDFSTQIRELHEECESLKKFKQINIALKSKLRKQIDSDLLLVSIKIIAQMIGMESKDSLIDLQTKQNALMQQQALQSTYGGNLLRFATTLGYRPY